VSEFLRLAGTLTMVCVLAGFFLSVANKQTEEAREYQDRLERLEAIKAVLPPYDNCPDKDKVKVEGVTFFIGKREGKVIGVAFIQEAEGYGGTIKVMMGVSPKEELLGIDIVGHLETPGLGAKIDEDKFKNQFFKDKRKIPLTIDSKIEVIKDGGEIEGITGATISSRGVCEAVKKGLKLLNRIKEKIIKEPCQL
jgi:electron transport complex protein RnfG